MKKLMAALLCLLMAVSGMPALAEYEIQGNLMLMPNPWVDTTEQGLMEALGLGFTLPAEAQKVQYRMLESQQLAECQFEWEGALYVARIKPVFEWEDISGVMYPEWDQVEECEIGWCMGEKRVRHEDGNAVYVCLWLDFAPGLMYSLTTRLPEAQEFDIADAARVLFTPVQDDVDGVDWAGDWEYARDVLRGCTGYAGTAGSSLKNARAACALLEYSLCAQASQLDAAAFAQTIQTAYDALTGEEKEEFAWNMESISSLLALALEDYDAQRPLFETAGISLQAEELMQAERAQEHWTALCGYIAQAMQAQSE